MSKLSCLLYLSVENETFDENKINSLILKSREQNLKANITGFLYYKQKHFFQYLEGNTNDLENLFLRLSNDPRHTILKYISDQNIEQRRFLHWSMGNLKTNELIQIKLEDVIIDYFKWMKTHEKKSNFNAWRLIEKLAYFKNKGHLSYTK